MLCAMREIHSSVCTQQTKRTSGANSKSCNSPQRPHRKPFKTSKWEFKDNEFLIILQWSEKQKKKKLQFKQSYWENTSWQQFTHNLAFVHFPLRRDWGAPCVIGSNETKTNLKWCKWAVISALIEKLVFQIETCRCEIRSTLITAAWSHLITSSVCDHRVMELVCDAICTVTHFNSAFPTPC